MCHHSSRKTQRQKTFAAPVARAPEPKARIESAQFGTGAESFSDTAEGQAAQYTQVMKLQRTVGNRRTGQIVRHAQRGGEVKIQRLFMTENSLYGGISDTNEFMKVQIDYVKKQPFWNPLVNAVRIYQLYTAQPFRRADAAQVRGLLAPVLTHAASFESFSFRERRKFENRLGGNDLEPLAVDAYDDAKQEREAITRTVADQSLPDGALPWNQALLIARTGTPFSEVLQDVDLAEDTEGGERGSPKNYGGGNISEVTGLTYDLQGGQERRIFKPNETQLAQGIDGMKFDHRSAQTAVRALASSRVQNLIKAKMEQAGQEFTKVITGFTLAIHKGKVGTTADLASGSEVTAQVKPSMLVGYNTDPGFYQMNFDINDIELQRKLANLQLFDMLTGQGDRNPGNILVDQKPGQETEVTGIDQDFAFSRQTRIDETIGKTGMPQLIDRYFAEGIMAINAGEMRSALKGLPLTAINATLKRLADIQVILHDMDTKDELIVAPGDQKHPTARKWTDIDPNKDYRYSSFGTQTTDYMGQIKFNKDEAYKAVKRNPLLAPKQVTRSDKKVWVLEYRPGTFLQANNDDGSDLFDLVRRAKAERQQETGFTYRGNRPQQGQQQGGFRIGSRKPVQ